MKTATICGLTFEVDADDEQLVVFDGSGETVGSGPVADSVRAAEWLVVLVKHAAMREAE